MCRIVMRADLSHHRFRLGSETFLMQTIHQQLYNLLHRQAGSLLTCSLATATMLKQMKWQLVERICTALTCHVAHLETLVCRKKVWISLDANRLQNWLEHKHDQWHWVKRVSKFWFHKRHVHLHRPHAYPEWSHDFSENMVGQLQSQPAGKLKKIHPSIL